MPKIESIAMILKISNYPFIVLYLMVDILLVAEMHFRQPRVVMAITLFTFSIGKGATAFFGGSLGMVSP
jgi:hypothetical protein